eukprot:scaffold10335_cov135-Skeletonema_menzelii.AAC.2
MHRQLLQHIMNKSTQQGDATVRRLRGQGGEAPPDPEMFLSSLDRGGDLRVKRILLFVYNLT